MKHTFVICAYKDSPYIEECIMSLKKQTVKSEIILATATPSGYLEALCEKYQIAYQVRDGAPGIGSDWNYALSLAVTPYVTIAHQDDVYENNYTEIMLKNVERWNESVRKNGKSLPFLIAFSRYYELINGVKTSGRMNQIIKGILSFPLWKEAFQGKRWRKRWVIRFGNAICCPSVFYNREYLEKLLASEGRPYIFQQDFRSNLDWETWEWMSRQDGAFLYSRERLMAHRIHGGSETSAIIKEHQRGQEDYRIFCKFWPMWIAKCISGVYRASEKGNAV